VRAGPLRVRFVAGRDLRVAYAVSRRAGNAVTRNRIRRRLRAAVDVGASALPTGAYLIAADVDALTIEFSDLCDAVAEIAHRVSR